MTADSKAEAGERRPRPPVGSGIRAIHRLNNATARSSASHSSSARADTARTRFCSSSNAVCRATWRPKRRRRSAKFSVLRRVRLDQRLEAADRLDVHGRLSTARARHPFRSAAAAVTIELLELSAGGEPRVIARATSNRDGRTDAPLIGDRPLPIGRYAFAVSCWRLFRADSGAAG